MASRNQSRCLRVGCNLFKIVGGGGGVNWLRLATNGGREDGVRERFGENFATLFFHRTRTAFDLMSSSYSAGYGWSTAYHSEKDIDVAAGKSAPRTIGIV